MKKHILTLASVGAFALLVACGGGNKENYPSYGIDMTTLRSAPPRLVSANAGTVQLSATAQYLNLPFDIMDSRIDPVSGQFHISSRRLVDEQRVFFLGFALIKPKLTGGYELAATEWSARTVWILQGEKYISTKDIKSKDGISFSTFNDPPLNRNQPTTIVVEFITANETTFLQGVIQWN